MPWKIRSQCVYRYQLKYFRWSRPLIEAANCTFVSPDRNPHTWCPVSQMSLAVASLQKRLIARRDYLSHRTKSISLCHLHLTSLAATKTWRIAVAFEVTPLKNKVSNTGTLTFHRTRDKVSNLKVFVPVRPLEVSNKKEVPHFGCAYRWIFSSDTQRLARGRRQINICFCVRSKIHVFHCSLSSFSWNECSLVTAETPDTDCDKFTSPQPGSKMLFWPINRHQKDDPLQCA